jgi:2-haloacid dehalogenase
MSRHFSGTLCGRLMGLQAMMLALATAGGPSAASLLRDATGSYAVCWLVAAAVFVAAVPTSGRKERFGKMDVRSSRERGHVMPAPEALAFDMYGTLVDPIRIGEQLERRLPDEASRVAEVWRQKQLEYTFRLTAMGRYEDFEQVTRKALDYALATTGEKLGAEQKDNLMSQYNDLEKFADVDPGLKLLRDAGHELVVFSNGSPRMLEELMDRARLRPFFPRGFISVDEVGTYKPSPKVYRHVAEKLGRKVGEVRLVSSNPFDVVGAEAAGMLAAWVDRSGGPFDTLGPRPETVVGGLDELADALVTR